jgi:modulator of FtsH protease
MDYNQVVTQISTVESTEPQRVLRNTYALLALSMVPTVIGALVSTVIGISGLTALICFGVAFCLMFAVQRYKDSGVGVVLMLTFTLFMGVTLGPLLQYALRFSNGGSLIALAAGGTGIIFLTLASIAATTKRDFSKLGSFLFAGVILILVAGIANMFLHLPVLALAISAVAVMVFSALIMFDINRIVHGGETNYVTATLAVYLDIFNIFVNLLQLLLAFAGDRR